MWDEQFESLLRTYLFFLPEDQELTPDTSLRDFGLDSLGMVELLSRLEGGYGVRFLDDALTLATFATAGSLWKTLDGLRADTDAAATR